jgi:hypothetical protein
VILKQGSVSDTSEDTIPTGGKVVGDFYKSGMVSARVNSHYAGLKAAQIEYAPAGNAFARLLTFEARQSRVLATAMMTRQPNEAPAVPMRRA